MTLIAFIGELGAGKTLCLTYMALRNWLKGKNVYSNYKLMFPKTSFDNKITYIRTIDDIEMIRDGFACLDELWLWMDSRSSGSRKNKIISMILTASRKRGFDIGYTTQSFHQIDKRIRDITDMIAIPQMSANNTRCTLMFLQASNSQVIRKYRFRTNVIFRSYDTNEIIRKI